MPHLVATIGEEVSRADIGVMVRAGLTCFRVNAGRYPLSNIHDQIVMVRSELQAANIKGTVFLDLPGNKARVWVTSPRRNLCSGDTLRLHYTPICPLDGDEIRLTGSRLFDDIAVGKTLLIRRKSRRFRLKVEAFGRTWIDTKVIESGKCGWGYHISVENIEYRPNTSLTDEDKEVLSSVNLLNPDFVCASFVDHPKIMKEVSLAIDSGGRISHLAKIESPTGVIAAKEIINSCNGAIIGRDDLSTWLSESEIHSITLSIISQCKERGRLSVPASNYFRSFVETGSWNPRELSVLKSVLEREPDYLYCNETGDCTDILSLLQEAERLRIL